MLLLMNVCCSSCIWPHNRHVVMSACLSIGRRVGTSCSCNKLSHNVIDSKSVHHQHQQHFQHYPCPCNSQAEQEASHHRPTTTTKTHIENHEMYRSVSLMLMCICVIKQKEHLACVVQWYNGNSLLSLSPNVTNMTHDQHLLVVPLVLKSTHMCGCHVVGSTQSYSQAS